MANHVEQIATADFFVVPTATYRLLFVLVILAHERRRIVHVGVTDHPTAMWTAQQLREAFPWDDGPRYLVRDRDTAFNTCAVTAAAMGIQEIVRTGKVAIARGPKTRARRAEPAKRARVSDDPRVVGFAD